MRTLKIAAVMFVLAAGLALAVTFPAARAGDADAVAVRDGKALVVAASGRVLRTFAPGGTVGRAAVSPDGDRVAMSVGTALPGGPDGVSGQVVIADSRNGAPLTRTRFRDAHIGGVAWGAGGRVAFVKDWYELWVLDASSGRLRKLADGRSFGPAAPGAGGLLFDPAFSPDGAGVVVGRVEATFEGEDDGLDNIWRVEGTGKAVRLSSLRRPEGGWRIARGPAVLVDSTIVFTTASSDAADWEIAALSDGSVRSLGRVAPDSYLAGVRDGDAYLLVMNPTTGTFDVVRSGERGTATLLRDVTWFDLPDPTAEDDPAPAQPGGDPRPSGTVLERLTGHLDRIARSTPFGR
jgi:hypothetical protein